jgi:hypothetical protein
MILWVRRIFSISSQSSHNFPVAVTCQLPAAVAAASGGFFPNRRGICGQSKIIIVCVKESNCSNKQSLNLSCGGRFWQDLQWERCLSMPNAMKQASLCERLFSFSLLQL